MSKGFLLIDGNNLGYAACATKKLHAGEGIEVQAVFGILRAFRPLVARFPQLTPIVLWDGRSWRYDVYREYKGKRDKPPETKHEIEQAAIRASFKAQKPLINRAVDALGLRSMIAFNLEADDLAGMLVQRYQPKGKKIVLITGDKDWATLIRPGVGWFDSQRDLFITNDTFAKKIGYEKKVKGSEETEWVGVPSPAAFLDVKCLAGDSSDEVPGVGGIGEKGAIDLVVKFGSVASFMNQANLEGDKLKLPKKLSDFATDETKWQTYLRNRRLMDLCSPEIPKPAGLEVKSPALDVAAFTELCEELQFKSILNDVEGWVEPFAVHAAQKEAA